MKQTKVKFSILMGSIPYMISDEEVHFTDKVLVSVDARKCTSLK